MAKKIIDDRLHVINTHSTQLEDEQAILRATLIDVMVCNQHLREQLIIEGIADPYEPEELQVDFTPWTTH